MGDVNFEKVHKIFETMVYDEKHYSEDTSVGVTKTKIKNLKIYKDPENLDQFISNAKRNGFFLKPKHLIKLGQLIEENWKTICQVEILARGILIKDNKKAVYELAKYFYYYASLIERQPKKIYALGFFTNDHPLWMLGMFLAPALAAGYSVIIDVGEKLAIIFAYIRELAIQSGIPKEVFAIFSLKLFEYTRYEKHLTVISFIEISYIAKTLNVDQFLLPAKTPFLIFEDADLESAIESVIQAAWEYQGMLPWSTNTILVQENIYEMFVQKFKYRIDKIRVGNVNEKFVDVSYPENPEILKNQIEIIQQAEKLGIEVYRKNAEFNPTLIIGTKNFENDYYDGTVTVLSFRNIDEAVNLANNTKLGLGASVWTEKIGLANELANKLEVSNVWINSHGLFSPDIPITPFKNSGRGWFGGSKGNFLSFRDDILRSYASLPDLPNNSADLSKNAYKKWVKYSDIEKIKTLTYLLEVLENNKTSLIENLSEEAVNDIINDLDSLLRVTKSFGKSNITSDYMVYSIIRPLGVIALNLDTNYEKLHFRLVFAALFQGNSIVIFNCPKYMKSFYTLLSKELPVGLLTLMDNNESWTRCIFNKVNFQKDNGEEINAWDEIFCYVTRITHIWSNIGESN